MSFKKSFKKQGISKLDNLVDTPNYIKPVEAPKKVGLSPIFWKIAVPVLSAGLLIGIPVIVISNMSMNSAKSSNLSGDPADAGSSPQSDPANPSPGEPQLDPLDTLVFDSLEYQRFNPNYESTNQLLHEDYLNVDFTLQIADLLGEKVADLSKEMNESLYTNGGYSLYHFKGSQATSSLIAYNNQDYYFYILNSAKRNESFENISTIRGLNGDMTIKVYNLNIYKYEFVTSIDETKTASIINGIKDINSDYETYDGLYKSGEFDVDKNPVGHCYKFVLSDGIDQVPLLYYSQFKYIVAGESAFDISSSPVLDIFDEFIEMN